MSAVGPQGDADLLAATRGGNAAAYGTLYERHATAARILARRLVRDPVEAETAVAETFTALLLLVRDGGGPREAFRPWLLAALRRTIRDRGRGERRPGRGRSRRARPWPGRSARRWHVSSSRCRNAGGSSCGTRERSGPDRPRSRPCWA
ncbi:RNA polymerase sigma factor [Streptosporangium sandarakinum]|uniref:RNA polymerase sigma factor n=1 Tax=Streptosporangium sandarakinum TaxID=1260955 RepID=UPI003D8DF33A